MARRLREGERGWYQEARGGGREGAARRVEER